MLEKLEQKLALIMKDLEQSIQNHNALIGAKTIIEQLISEAKSELIDSKLKPEIDVIEAVIQ